MRKVVERAANELDVRKKVTLDGVSKLYDGYDKKTDKLICFRNVFRKGVESYLYSLVTGELIAESKIGLTIISDSYYCTNHSEKNILGYVSHEVKDTNEKLCEDGVTVYSDASRVEYIHRNMSGESMVIAEDIAILNAGKGKIIVIDTKKDIRMDFNFDELVDMNEKLDIINKFRDSKMLYITYGVYFNFFDLVNKRFKYDKFLEINLKYFKIYNNNIYYITRDGKLLDDELNSLIEGEYSDLKFHDNLPYVFLKSDNKHGLAKLTNGEIVIDTVYDEVIEKDGEFLALKKTVDKRYVPES